MTFALVKNLKDSALRKCHVSWTSLVCYKTRSSLQSKCLNTYNMVYAMEEPVMSSQVLEIPVEFETPRLAGPIRIRLVLGVVLKRT